jgi:hypothetical protein
VRILRRIRRDKSFPDPCKKVLKAPEFYKRNLLIVNNDQSKTIELPSDQLFKLSRMTSVNELYENSLHNFTFDENKKDFRDAYSW